MKLQWFDWIKLLDQKTKSMDLIIARSLNDRLDSSRKSKFALHHHVCRKVCDPTFDLQKENNYIRQ